jgi:HAD superfamily hydrolase (TIGR01509 family)
MQQLNTAIFDMDGLIIDSEPFWRAAEIKVFETVGLQLTHNDCRKTVGMRFDEVVEFWYRQHPWEGKSKNRIMHEVIEEMESAILHHATPMNGAIECIEFFKSNGYKTAIASSSAGKLIRACVKRLQLEDFIDKEVSAELFSHGKPHPQVFIETAHLLGSHSMECLVLEDSFYGVLAAKAARMYCIAVPDHENKNNPKFVIADLICDSLHDAVTAFSNRQ